MLLPSPSSGPRPSAIHPSSSGLPHLKRHHILHPSEQLLGEASAVPARPWQGGVLGLASPLSCRAKWGTSRELGCVLADAPALFALLQHSSLVPEASRATICQELKMICWFLFLSLLGFLPLATLTCPSACQCSTNIVYCSSRQLTESSLPASFSPSTQTIYLNDNQLTSIPSGLLDNLQSLQVVYLWGNPWECDCNILYLRSWLQWQQNRTLYRNVVCASPEHLRGRIIAYLSEDELISTCQYWYCSIALISQICLFLFILLQAVLLLFIILFLHRFQRIANVARQTTKEIHQHVDTWASLSENACDID
ncbi:platelet glycoprotein Ib beta chain [Malaclemys terrapin pileata]|uniref:platelet glycoprotein Ib beta chain n=1 Tax=Malaclemys terrapin pileata TaxID=2991368 RepID=UPI0023A7E6A1|nr:platelet glycoprotein Ib beta chain [Malaclemys terrapin pileata]